VRNRTTFGAFIEIEPGIDGLVHVSDMSWTKRVEHPSEVVQKGDELDVMVLHVDSDSKRISLGLKQLYDDPWPELVIRFAKGHEQDGTIARLQDKGVVVDLGEGVEGFVPGSHSGVAPESLDAHYRVGESVPLKVISSDAGDRRIVLEVLAAPERRAAAQADEAADGDPGGPEAKAAAEPRAEAADQSTVDSEAGGTE